MTVWGKKSGYVYKLDEYIMSELSYDNITISRTDREEMIAYVEEKLTEGWQLNGDSYVEKGLGDTYIPCMVHCQGLKQRKGILWS